MPLVFLICFFNADCLSAKETSDKVFSISLFGYPRTSSHVLKLHMASWKFFFEEFVLRSLIASPLIKPLLTAGGWQEEYCVY